MKQSAKRERERQTETLRKRERGEGGRKRRNSDKQQDRKRNHTTKRVGCVCGWGGGQKPNYNLNDRIVYLPAHLMDNGHIINSFTSHIEGQGKQNSRHYIHITHNTTTYFLCVLWLF